MDKFLEIFLALRARKSRREIRKDVSMERLFLSILPPARHSEICYCKIYNTV